MVRLMMIAAVLVLVIFSVNGAEPKDCVVNENLDSLMMVEADAFLEALPAGLQHGQRDAVLAAIKGDTAQLNNVRQARKVKIEDVDNVETYSVDDRLCWYFNTADPRRDKPMLIYFHGGGWTFGGISSCARFCQEICRQSGVTVLAVNYRLAPEFPYPLPLDDCESAVRLALAKAGLWKCSTERIVLGGDSSGGNLAVATALRLMNDNLSVSKLLLFYPVVKAYDDKSESWRKWGDGYGLDSDLMDAFNMAYAKGCEKDGFVSVADADENMLSRLPETLMVSAGRDILLDQGTDFIGHLRRLGVKARQVVFPSAVHLFITVNGQDAAFNEAVRYAKDFIYEDSCSSHCDK